MRPVVRNAKWGVALACLYEVAAICTGKTPTISELSGRFPWLGPAVLIGLAIHLGQQPRPQVVVITPRV